MLTRYKDKVTLWHFDNLTRHDNIVHFVTTRRGGYSDAPYNSLNLGLHSGDNPIKVMKNRELLSHVLEIEDGCFLTSRQVHGDKVRVITEEAIRSGISVHKLMTEAADAMITDLPNFCLAVMIADCTPILLYDPKIKAIGIAHAGWRGTVKKIAQKTVESMIKEFGCKPSDIMAGIGPSISPEHYEVGKDVIEEVKKNLDKGEELIARISDNGKGHFDLWEANRRQLLKAGIPGDNIETAGLCTYGNPDLFFSYRYQGDRFGRLMAGIMLRK